MSLRDLLLLMILAGAPTTDDARPQPLELTLTVQSGAVAVGETAELSLKVTNRSKRAQVIDNGSLVSFAVVRDGTGAEIPQWPYMDILLEPPGKEAFWTIKVQETLSLPLRMRLVRGEWSGFGIPGGKYQGLALEVGYPAGRAIHAVAAVPAKITIRQRWTNDSDTVQRRAKQFGVRPNPWAGTLDSNAVTLELVDSSVR